MAGKFVRDWSDVIRNMPKRADSTNKRDGGEVEQIIARLREVTAWPYNFREAFDRGLLASNAADALAESRAEVRSLRETVERMGAEIGPLKIRAERLAGDVREIYRAMPPLPITAETMEAATDLLTKFCIDFNDELKDAALEQGPQE